MAGTARLIALLAALQLPLAGVTDIPLPGNPTRLDYESLDAAKNLLFIAHLGDGNVVVVDTKRRRVIATIANVARVHGVLAVPARNVVYASATGTNEVVAIDEGTQRVVARMPGGVYPDGMAYDPITARLFVSDEHGKTETVIDTRANRRIATIDLHGEAGNTQYDPVSRHVLVNVQTREVLAEIDPKRNAVVRETALPGCAGNHGLLLVPGERRAFIACEDNATFVWLDMRTRRVRQTWPIGDSPDVLALNPETHRVYVAAESGVVSVFADGATVTCVAQGFLAPAAHTVAADSRTGLLYVPLQNVSGRPVLRVYRDSIATNDRTKSGSNCVPAQRTSSSMASPRLRAAR